MFIEAIEHILKVEAGFVDHPDDKGGPTNFGITLATLAEYRKTTVTIADVRSLTEGEAMGIYKTLYWDACKLDSILDPNKQLVIFDQAVNRGQSSAILQAQTVLMGLGTPTRVDGFIGKETAMFINGLPYQDFCREYIQASEMFYVKLAIRKPKQLAFLTGWINRMHILQDMVWTGFSDRQILFGANIRPDLSDVA